MDWAQSIRRKTYERLLCAIRCARCASPVTVRFNRKTGTPFMGCARYPKCTWAQPIPAAVEREANPICQG